MVILYFYLEILQQITQLKNTLSMQKQVKAFAGGKMIIIQKFM